jgi:hypothetical protein
MGSAIEGVGRREGDYPSSKLVHTFTELLNKRPLFVVFDLLSDV